MRELIRRSFQSRRSDLRRHWEILLRQTPVCSPLAAHDVLVHLMDWTLEELFETLTQPPNRRHLRSTSSGEAAPSAPFSCRCGLNPLRDYFSCLEQALAQTLEEIYGQAPDRDSTERDAGAAETKLAFTIVSRRELETFCSVCQHSPSAPLMAAGGLATALQTISSPSTKG